MPTTINGFGTTYLGARDRHPDGTFVATEWVTFFYVPVLPLRSWRVLFAGELPEYGQYNPYYYVGERVPLHVPEVLRTYVLSLGSLAGGLWTANALLQSEWWFPPSASSSTTWSLILPAVLVAIGPFVLVRLFLLRAR